MIEIVEEDFVDWEPLIMRFVSQAPLSNGQAERLAEYIHDWIDLSAESNPDSWRFAKEWTAKVVDQGCIEVSCDLMPPEAIPALARAVEDRFPTIYEVRLGYPAAGMGSNLDWMPFESGRFEVDGRMCILGAFSISFSPVTIDQFEKFVQATGHKPVPDNSNYDNFTIENARGTVGSGAMAPMFGATHDDAVAYCEWAKLRLPTEIELSHFFRTCVVTGRTFEWAFPCWSSTLDRPDYFVARHGPYVAENLDEPIERSRLVLARHHFQWPDPPCFRVVAVQQKVENKP